MVSIESTIREFSESASSGQMRIFVASCAERTAQLFTGLIGANGERSQDVELAIRCMDLLWQSQPQISWDEIAESFSSFPELTGDEEPPGLLAYAYDAAAMLYYAARYRAAGKLADVISCSNHALNSAEYISEELEDGVDRYEIELQNQVDDIALLSQTGNPDDHDSIQLMRDSAQKFARARLAELTSV
ncbi:hypothetical protein [Streptomyces varsoviensis]|uniref:DUF416 family protein n=1 Tax=Streptomyces varsoviensis TaxID=67373 RepID=A0ABR5JAU0_9ACTN|nr:hypothetical protein [Streptomyces varsoviensis]KOG90572.1 hypothetical protein ADK38_07980 [Streptomyces varsoviensis]